MVLSAATIRACPGDEQLFDALCAELGQRLPSELRRDLNRFVELLPTLPPGLRAMAATFQLDVSVTLDDLGWHFANWHHQPYAKETLRGLRVLEAHEAAEIFSAAYALALPYWNTIGRLIRRDFQNFVSWYSDSDLEKALDPLNMRIWKLRETLPNYGLMRYWLTYARKYPYNLAHVVQ
jgi:hypothetical protein